MSTEEKPIILGDIRDDENAMMKVIAMLGAKAAKARIDPAEFFTFVMREEHTQKPLVLAPHQKILFDFVMAHEKCVIMLPVGHSKTFSMGALALWMLGHNPTMRGAIVSATQDQAKKPLKMVREYIEKSAELRLVFPKLRPQPGGKWTEDKITVDRPMGIKDHSVVSIGIDGAIQGSRLNFVLVDDILNRENTSTPEQRAKVYEFFDSSILSRLDPTGSKIIVTNTAWHSRDLCHDLMRNPGPAWPTLKMSATGQVRIYNTDFGCKGQPGEFDLRDSPQDADGPDDYPCRLTAHDPDEYNEVPLFPLRFPTAALEEIRNRHLPIEFARAYLNEVRNDTDAACKREWIDQCKMMGRGMTLASEYRGSDATFTGVDLAVSPNESADYTAFFTFRILQDGRRLLLDVEYGRFDGPTIVQKIVSKSVGYGSVVRVENNACFKPDANVLTMRGYVPISEVNVGDLVWTHQGRWRPVTNVISGQAKVMSKVEAVGSLSTTATPNHWLYMREAARTPGRKGGHVRPSGEAAWVSCGLVDRPGYVATPIVRWPDAPAILHVPKTRRTEAQDIPVDEDLALTLGLYMAEGHSTKGQAYFTFGAHETYLAEFVDRTLRRHFTCKITHRVDGSTHRVIVNSTALATALRTFGKGPTKCAPLEWLGWDLSVRTAIVRGWLLGDGCLRANNHASETPSRFFSGSTISRNWAFFVRNTLLENGYRATVTSHARENVSTIAGRVIRSGRIFTVSLNGEDSFILRKRMVTDIEAERWMTFSHSGRRANSAIVIDDQFAWSKYKMENVGTFEAYNGPVFNLEVEEDHSYVVEDMVVHNAQDFIRQFASAIAPIPIKAHTTGRTKAHPEHGVPGLFLELSQKGWVIPCSMDGRVAPGVQRWIEECLEYTPSHHTGDVLMASYFAREQAKAFGLSWGNTNANTGGNNIGANLMSR